VRIGFPGLWQRPAQGPKAGKPDWPETRGRPRHWVRFRRHTDAFFIRSPTSYGHYTNRRVGFVPTILHLSPAGCVFGRHSGQWAKASSRLPRPIREQDRWASGRDSRRPKQTRSGHWVRFRKPYGRFSALTPCSVEPYEADHWLRDWPFPCLAARRTLDQELSTQLRPDGSAATIHRVDGSQRIQTICTTDNTDKRSTTGVIDAPVDIRAIVHVPAARAARPYRDRIDNELESTLLQSNYDARSGPSSRRNTIRVGKTANRV
jgi:hypothetical protein